MLRSTYSQQCYDVIRKVSPETAVVWHYIRMTSDTASASGSRPASVPVARQREPRLQLRWLGTPDELEVHATGRSPESLP